MITGDYVAALIIVIRYFGSQAALARELKVSRSVINNWLNRDKRIPFEYAVAMEIRTKGLVSRYDLAPYARSIIEG